MSQLNGVTAAEFIAQKRKEIAELEAQYAYELFANRPKKGDYARLISGGHAITNGAIVVIKQAEPVDYDGDLSFRVRSVLSPELASEWVTECERLTPAEAKAALHAQVEALFNVEEADESRGI